MKRKIYFLCLMLLSIAFLFMTSCGNKIVNTPEISGVENDAVYYLNESTVKPLFDTGKAVLSKDGGEGVSFASGTEITEEGDFVLTVTNNDKIVKVTFSVIERLALTGIIDGKIYYLGKDTIKPVFNKGSATVKKDDGDSANFVSGTDIAELGTYEIKVTYKTQLVTVSFTVAEYFEVYEHSMTDYFSNTVLNSAYIRDSSSKLSIEDGILSFANIESGDPWSILKRKFESVNATLYPYLEINIIKVFEAPNVRFELALMTEEYGADSNLLTAVYQGKYYVDVLSFIRDKGLNETSQDLYIKLAVVGNYAGDAGVSIDYYKSISELPQAEAAARYDDTTLETLLEWKGDTASIVELEGAAAAYVSDPNSGESYGKTLKRVELNTNAYPFLVVDIASVSGSAVWQLKYSTAEISETLLFDGGKGTGRMEINLASVSGIGLSDNKAVVLYFYIIGTGDDDFVYINGFETLAESERAPSLNIDFSSSAGWTAGSGSAVLTLTTEGNAGTFTLTGDGYADMVYHAKLNTKEYKYLVIKVSAVSGYHLMKLNTAKELYTQSSAAGTYYINMQADGSGFDSSYNLNAMLNFYVIGSNGNYAVIDEIYTTNEEPDQTLIEDFASDNWNCSLGEYSIADGNMTLSKKLNEGMAKISKNFVLDTSKYDIIEFSLNTNGYSLDSGFSIGIINQGAAGWPNVMVLGNDSYYVRQQPGANGTTDYKIYLDLSKQESITGKSSITLFFEICIQYGDALKTAVFDEIKFVEEIPAISLAVEDYSADTGFSINDAVYTVSDGCCTVTTSGTGATLSKYYTIDTSTYTVMEFTVIIPFGKPDLDTAFYIEILDDVNWISVTMQYNASALNFTKLTDGNGNITYKFYIDISNAVKLSDGSPSTLGGNAALKVNVKAKWLSTDKTYILDSICFVEGMPE